MIRSKKLSLSSVSSKKREGRLWSTDSSLFPLISKRVKISSFVSTNLGNLSFFLIIVFKKCVWGLNWPFRNVWAFTSRVTFWSVNCYYHKNRQQWFILQKEPIFAVKTVALSIQELFEATVYTMNLGNGHTPKHNNDPLHLQMVGNAPQHLCALLQTKTWINPALNTKLLELDEGEKTNSPMHHTTAFPLSMSINIFPASVPLEWARVAVIGSSFVNGEEHQLWVY